MAPAFLIAGATGNTGTGVVETLSRLLESSTHFPGYRILALTRSRDSAVAQRLSKLPHVEIIEQNWVEIDAAWLRSNEVERVFLASHNQPNQFAEESTFHLNALQAGVHYVVRISTTAANVRPDCPAYYPRTHWAIETMLSTPEFAALHWTSLQPNIFFALILGPVIEYVKRYRETGNLTPFATLLSADAPVALIDAAEVGVFAAHLLVTDDITPHNHQRYVLNGPSDVNGAMIAKLVETAIGTPLRDVAYKDLSIVDYLVANTSESRNVVSSIHHALDSAHAGLCTAATTSKEVLDLAPPKTTLEHAWEKLLAE